MKGVVAMGLKIGTKIRVKGLHKEGTDLDVRPWLSMLLPDLGDF